MASDDLRARIAEALCPPHHRVGSVSSGQPLTPLSPCQLHRAQADTVASLAEAEVDAVAERGAAAIAAMGADVRAVRAERDRYRLAWQSARQRATRRRLNGERAVGGPIRQALIDAGIITAEDRVADAVEKIRALGPHLPCKHGVLPEQGLCLYCGTEQRATVPGVDACYEIRHCVMWGFCHRCAPELAAEASRLYGHTGGTPEAYAAIVKGLTEPAQHSCGNCEGIDPDTCLNNPDRTKES